MNARPLTPGAAHTPAEWDRIEAYRVRLDTTMATALGGPRQTRSLEQRLSLRGPNGHIDSTLVAIESNLRSIAGLPAYIAELDLTPAHRNPAPWRYCTNATCDLCPVAIAVRLPDAGTHLTRATRRIARTADTTTARILNALAAFLDRIIGTPGGHR